jgi:hypothetical protein
VSHESDHACELYDELLVAHARIPHLCSACRDTIPVHHSYWRITIIDEGDFQVVKRCLRCQLIHLHLRTLGGDDMWPNERLDCGEEYKQHWGREPPPEIAALAFLSASDTPQGAEP